MSSTRGSGSSRTSSAPSGPTPSCTRRSSATSRCEPRVRHEVNVLGTKRLLEYCVAYGVQRVVVLSSHYVYGALPDNPLLPGRGVLAERQPHLPRGARPGRGRHPVQRVPVAASRDRDRRSCGPSTTLGSSVHSTMARLSAAALRPHDHGLRSDDAVHPRGRRRRSDGARARARDARRVQRGRPRRGAAVASRSARPAAPPIPLPEHAGATSCSPSSSVWASTTCRPAPSTSSSIPCTLDGRRFRAATGFQPRRSLEDIFASVRR